MKKCLYIILLLKGFYGFSQIPIREIYTNNDKINLAKDNFAPSETVFGAILKIPGISIDNRNNLIYNFQTIDIAIDGKLINLPSIETIGILKSIPTGILYKIEVIRNPNVFYNTDSDFLINIKTENLVSNKSSSIFNFTVEDGENSGVKTFLNFKRGYENFFFQINSAFSAGKSIEKEEIIKLISENSSTLFNYENNFVSKNDLYFGASLFYDLNFRDKIGVDYKHYSNNTINNFDVHSENNFALLTNSQKTGFNDLTVYYLQILDKGGTKFKMQGNLTFYDKNDISNNFNNIPLNNFTYDFSRIGDFSFKKELFKADLIIPTTYLPFTLNSGFEYFKRTNFITYPYEEKEVKYSIQQKNLYVLFGKEIEDFSTELGFKIAKNKSYIDSLDVFKNEYVFLPSVEFSYNINNKNKVNLSYTRKLNQTNSLFINSLLYTNPTINAKADILFNTSDNFFATFSYSNYNYLKISYSHPNRTYYLSLNPLNNNLSFKTLMNPNYYNVDFSFPLSLDLIKLDFNNYFANFENYTLYLDLGYNALTSYKKKFSGYYLNLIGHANVFFDIKLIINSSFSNKSNWIGNGKSTFRTGFSFEKKLFSDKVNLSLGVNDIFNTYKQSAIFFNTNNILKINNDFNLQKITLSLTYNFSSTFK